MASEGWSRSGVMRRDHYYRDGRSLCGNIFYRRELLIDDRLHGERDCISCQRIRDKEMLAWRN